MSDMRTINGLSYVRMDSNDIGKCGVVNRKKNIYFPFFLIGACGDKDAVISWDGKREYIVAPKEMNYNWFKLIAIKLKANPFFDYDWESFKNNILKPNKEHLKTILNIDDEKVDTLLSDGYVFINNFDKNWDNEDEDIAEMEKRGMYYPNFKNFLEQPLSQLEY